MILYSNYQKNSVNPPRVKTAKGPNCGGGGDFQFARHWRQRAADGRADGRWLHANEKVRASSSSLRVCAITRTGVRAAKRR